MAFEQTMEKIITFYGKTRHDSSVDYVCMVKSSFCYGSKLSTPKMDGFPTKQDHFCESCGTLILSHSHFSDPFVPEVHLAHMEMHAATAISPIPRDAPRLIRGAWRFPGKVM